jgi:hypothetical protein
MKIGISKVDGYNQMTIDGRLLTCDKQGSMAVFIIDNQLGRGFANTPIGVIATLMYMDNPVKQRMFMSGAGVEGWANTARLLNQDIEETLSGLEDGPLPGCTVEIAKGHACLYLEPPKDEPVIKTPTKKLVSASGIPFPRQ